jgi:hypothetical protein
MSTFVYPFRSDRIWLRARRQTWKSLAPSIKRTLSDAAKNIVTIREEIAADAQVHSMPPVEIVAEHWVHGGARILARVLPLELWDVACERSFTVRQGGAFPSTAFPSSTEVNDFFLNPVARSVVAWKL